jgi:ribosomal protein L34E
VRISNRIQNLLNFKQYFIQQLSKVYYSSKVSCNDIFLNLLNGIPNLNTIACTYKNGRCRNLLNVSVEKRKTNKAFGTHLANACQITTNMYKAVVISQNVNFEYIMILG